MGHTKKTPPPAALSEASTYHEIKAAPSSPNASLFKPALNSGPVDSFFPRPPTAIRFGTSGAQRAAILYTPVYPEHKLQVAISLGYLPWSCPDEGEQPSHFCDQNGNMIPVAADSNYRYSAAKSQHVPSPIARYTYAIIPISREHLRPDFLLKEGCYLFARHYIDPTNRFALECQQVIVDEMTKITMHEAVDRKWHREQIEEIKKLPREQIFGDPISLKADDPKGDQVGQVDICQQDSYVWQQKLGWFGHGEPEKRIQSTWYTTCILPKAELTGGPTWYDWSHAEGEWKERNTDCLASGLPKYARSRAWLEERLDSIDKLRIIFYDQRVMQKIWDDGKEERQAEIERRQDLMEKTVGRDAEMKKSEPKNEDEESLQDKDKKRKTAKYSAPSKKRGLGSRKPTNATKASLELAQAKKRGREEVEEPEDGSDEHHEDFDIPGTPRRKAPRLEADVEIGRPEEVDQRLENSGKEGKSSSLDVKLRAADKGFLEDVAENPAKESQEELSRKRSSSPSPTEMVIKANDVQDSVEGSMQTPADLQADTSKCKSVVPASNTEQSPRQTDEEKVKRESTITVIPFTQWDQVKSPRGLTPTRTQNVNHSSVATKSNSHSEAGASSFQPRRSGRQRTKKRQFGYVENAEDTPKASRAARPRKSRKTSQKASPRGDAKGRAGNAGIDSPEGGATSREKTPDALVEAKPEVPESPSMHDSDTVKISSGSQTGMPDTIVESGTEPGEGSHENEEQVVVDTQEIMRYEPTSAPKRSPSSIIEETDNSVKDNVPPMDQPGNESAHSIQSMNGIPTDEMGATPSEKTVSSKDEHNKENISPAQYAGQKRKASSVADNESDLTQHSRKSDSHSSRVHALTQKLGGSAARDFAQKMKDALAKEKEGQAANTDGGKRKKARRE